MNQHRFDWLSLIAGLVFVVVGLAFLIPARGEDLARTLVQVVGWGGPVLVVAAGLALILPSLRRRTQPEAEPPGDLDLEI
jgi:hypothetical protein